MLINLFQQSPHVPPSTSLTSQLVLLGFFLLKPLKLYLVALPPTAWEKFFLLP